MLLKGIIIDVLSLSDKKTSLTTPLLPIRNLGLSVTVLVEDLVAIHETVTERTLDERGLEVFG